MIYTHTHVLFSYVHYFYYIIFLDNDSFSNFFSCVIHANIRHDDEKHSLPSFHQEVLDNKLLSLQQREEDYKRLDQDRHVQHERLMANIDVMKKDLMKEYKDKEYRLLTDLEEER